MISIRFVEFSGSWSGLSRQKRRGTPDMHLLKESFERRSLACVG